MSIYKEILEKIENTLSDFIIVSDPDCLLREEEILLELEKRKYKLITYDDPLLLRYKYETNWRTYKQEGKIPEYKIIIHLKDEAFDILPFDILNNGRNLSFSLSELFPSLDPGVIRELTIIQLEKLYDLYIKSGREHRGQRDTKEYVLKSIFKIDPHMIDVIDDLFKYLVSRHYSDENYPPSIDEYLTEVLSEKFPGIPVESMLKREFFLEFLRKEWKVFLLSYLDKNQKSTVPFENKDIKVYMDNYFLEGILKPVLIYKTGRIPSWARPGLIGNDNEEERERFTKLFENLKGEMPSEKSPCNEWLKFTGKWAECLRLYNELNKPFEGENDFQAFYLSMEETFQKWMVERYSSILSLSYLPPRTVHHVLSYISSGLKEEKRAALIVLDGMSIDQWLIMRDCLSDNKSFRIKENRIFAMVPTITSVSRQSLLSGHIPEFFSSSITTTAKEENLWKNFWEKEEKNNLFLANQKFTEEKNYDFTKVSVLAVIITTIDDMNHGAVIGSGGVYKSIKYWMDNGIFIRFLKQVLSEGFTVYITSDHGNIYATGTGRLKEKNLSESRGQRVHIFENTTLRDMALKPGKGIKWPCAGLPENYYPILAEGKEAFTTEGSKIICHGGISLEEVIVPFIEIRREKDGQEMDRI